MKVLESAEAKTHFSSILKDIEAGNEVAITYGRKKQTVAVIIPYDLSLFQNSVSFGTNSWRKLLIHVWCNKLQNAIFSMG